MKIVLAADGSKFTKKALAFLVTHETIRESDELVVIHVQSPLSPRVKAMLGAAAVREYHRSEAERVLKPIRTFLDKHGIPSRTEWTVGAVAPEVVRLARKEKAHVIVAGTHGHGLLGRAVLGSVAQKLVTEADVPVLLVR